MNKKIVFIYFLIILTLEVTGLFILPETIVMQINTLGESSWVINKYLGITVLFVLSVAGGVHVLKTNEKSKRGYMILAIMIVVHFVVYFFN